MISESLYRSLIIIFFTMPLIASFFVILCRNKLFLVKLISVCSMFIQLAILTIFITNNNIYGWDNFGPMVNIPWLPQWGINIILGLDGVTLPYLLISAILAPIIYLFILPLQSKENYFSNSILFLILLFGMYGSFLSLDLVVFYLLWELVLIPVFIMVGLGKESQRQNALMKFLIYSLGSSLLMLLGMIIIGLHLKNSIGFHSFNYFNLKSHFLIWNSNDLLNSPQWWACSAFLLAFFIKGHAFPLHSWLPDLYRQGTPLATVSVAALLFNMATYAMIRFLPSLFPQALSWWSTPIMLMGSIGVLYGALCVLAQKDLRQVLAFMSVSHMGFFLMGFGTLTTSGIQAAYIQTINHGILAASFSLLVFYITEKKSQYHIGNLGGLVKTMPILSIAFFIILLGNIGLPGTNGFVGEFLVLLMSFQKAPLITSFATLGVILSATYGLILFQKLFFNDVQIKNGDEAVDLSGKNLIMASILIFFVFLLGIKPMNFFQPAMDALKNVVVLFVH